MIQAADNTIRICESHARSLFIGEGEKRAGDVATYLAHVGAGLTMREIARVQGRQPSTVMRAVRRVELQRDDPLLEAAISRLEADNSCVKAPPKKKKAPKPTRPSGAGLLALDRLAEPESFLLVARNADKAGVFCAKNAFRKPLSLIPVDLAMAFLARDWIKVSKTSETTTRYVLTSAGRSMLRRGDTGQEKNHGLAEAPTPFARQHQIPGERHFTSPITGEVESIRVNTGKSPLGWLARRKDGNGGTLLTPDEVEAGERLREDFEIAQIGPKIGQDWSRFLAPVDGTKGGGRTPSEGPQSARDRFTKAMKVLGPGLGDAALRICCFHEGLEATERRMGWSARSGKVVLKLALQRLVDYYGLQRRAA